MGSSTRKVAVASLCLAASACGVHLKNQTPDSFTYTSDDLPAAEAMLYPGSTPGQLRAFMTSPAHRFLLEAQPYGGASNVRPLVVVDGVEHAMTGYGGSGGGGLFAYEATPQCTRERYDYRFIVRYRAGWFGERSETLGSAGMPLPAVIDGHGQLVWFVTGSQPKHANGSIKVLNGTNNNETVVRVQNLSDTPTRITLIGWVFGEADAPKFQLLNLPAYPHELACGQSLEFTVKWNPVGNDLDDLARLGIMSQYRTMSGTWSGLPTIFISARGLPAGS